MSGVQDGSAEERRNGKEWPPFRSPGSHYDNRDALEYGALAAANGDELDIFAIAVLVEG